MRRRKTAAPREDDFPPEGKMSAAAHIPARAPFRFFGCIELGEILGLRARDERELMEAGRGRVRQNFLITRHLRDYLSLLVHLTS